MIFNTPIGRKLTLVSALFIFFSSSSIAQEIDRPKLVVGIVVDQMRYEYLYRFYDDFGENGFKRLMNEGFNNKNTHYNYVPTYTAPGHASIYTGTTPTTHGIIGNDWYDKRKKHEKYCVSDSSFQSVGCDNDAGEMSPHNMLTTTITDELRLFNKESKVIGVSIKDRGSILPAGHMATAAYWFDGNDPESTGNFITSTYYMKELPDWVKSFNNQKLPKKYLSQTWNTLKPMSEYGESARDNRPYERKLKGKDAPIFPYHLKKLKKTNGNIELLPDTPFGNTIVREMSQAAINGENLGKDNVTDFLAMSFSSTDYIGHRFGPYSIEVQDTYLRLDQELETFLNFLDKKVGKENYLIFLTADHAVATIPRYLKENKAAAGNFSFGKKELVKLNTHLSNKHSEGDWVEYKINTQLFLNHALSKDKNVNINDLRQDVVDYMIGLDGVAKSYSATDINNQNHPKGLKNLLENGYNQKRSGDVLYVMEPGWHASWDAATHGSAYAYDTHVPLLWYGWNIEPGQSTKYQAITDITPTLSMLLNIGLPNGCSGQPIEEVLK